jgi:hypothetical protein
MNQPKPTVDAVVNRATKLIIELQGILFMLQEEIGTRDQIVKQYQAKEEKKEKKPKKES